MYHVQDRGVCRACGAPAYAAAEEPYCSNCGGHLELLSLPWHLCHLQEIASPADPDLHLSWEGRTFSVVDGDDNHWAHEHLADEHRAGGPFPQGSYLLAGQRSDVGDGRAGRANEDSIYVLTMIAVTNSLASPTVGLYLVADGMGGHMDGEVASRTACEVISADLLAALGLPAWQGFPPDADSMIELIEGAVQRANSHIHDAAAARNSNMGTTVVLALVVEDQVFLANVGDSRAYLWGREGLGQITDDHSHVFALKQKGLIEEDAIYTHPRRNEIYRSLGAAPAVEVDCFHATLMPGDLLLLCSDGLWEMLRNDGIADVLQMNLGDPQVICDELVNRANGAGGDDNISVVVVVVRAVG